MALDIFSRYVGGWMLASQESATLAKKLISQSCEKQAIAPGQLTIHADRGPSMTSKPVAFLLADLGITQTHSRPYLSDDNPFFESQFKSSSIGRISPNASVLWKMPRLLATLSLSGIITGIIIPASAF